MSGMDPSAAAPAASKLDEDVETRPADEPRRSTALPRWRDALAFGLLAIVPALPYWSYLFSRAVPRFALSGDYAGLEISTRLAFSGKTLLGPYSRFGFNHPGPFYFLVTGPAYFASGETSRGLYVGACLVNTLAAFSIAAAVSLAATRKHALAAALLIGCWFAAFGDLCAAPWNPVVVVLPLAAFIFLAALAAGGKLAAVPIAAFFGYLAAETHLSTIPVVVVVGIGATFRCVTVRRRDRAPLGRLEILSLTVAAILTVVAIAPPLFEQAISPGGNLTKLARFFLTSREPPKAMKEAASSWAYATAWLPDRIVNAQLTKEGGEPTPFSSALLPASLSSSDTRWLIAWTLGVGIALIIAVRRRAHLPTSVLSAGIASTAASVIALRAVVGPMLHYLVFWTTASSWVSWLGVALLVPDLMSSRRPSSAAERVAFAAALGVALTSAGWNHAWLRHHDDFVPREADQPLQNAYATLLERLRASRETPVLHVDGAWQLSLGLLNELSRDGVDVHVDESERWILGRQFPSPAGIERPLHIYTARGGHQLHTTACLTLLARSADVELWGAERAMPECQSSGR